MKSSSKVTEWWCGYLEICFEEQDRNKHFKYDLRLLLCHKIMKNVIFSPKILHLEAMVNPKTPIKPGPTQKTFLFGTLETPTNFIWSKNGLKSFWNNMGSITSAEYFPWLCYELFFIQLLNQAIINQLSITWNIRIDTRYGNRQIKAYWQQLSVI